MKKCSRNPVNLYIYNLIWVYTNTFFYRTHFCSGHKATFHVLQVETQPAQFKSLATAVEYYASPTGPTTEGKVQFASRMDALRISEAVGEAPRIGVDRSPGRW